MEISIKSSQIDELSYSHCFNQLCCWRLCELGVGAAEPPGGLQRTCTSQLYVFKEKKKGVQFINPSEYYIQCKWLETNKVPAE